MKKLLLLTLLVASIHGFPQVNREKFRPLPFGLSDPYSNETAYSESVNCPGELKPPFTNPAGSLKDFEIVNPVLLGQSGNAFGFSSSGHAYLWADNNINTITFMHRMTNPPGTGYLAYDISTNGGLTWTNNVQTYDPTLEDAFDARYPQGGIYNPQGNKDPNQAYFHYFAPTLDDSNPGNGVNWGGYAHGVKKLSAGSTPTEHNRSSEPPFYQLIPDAFTITQTGDAWMVDANYQGAPNKYNYLDELIIGRGTWVEELSDYEYLFDLIPLEIVSENEINDLKVAFAPDGMTGYICVMTDLPVTLPYTSYHPILFKTTDGGETWSEPIEVQLGGEDGLEAVREYISDDMLTYFYEPEPVPPRDEIPYYMGYECDLAVDAWGNPHISGTICISNLEEGVFYSAEGLMAMFHIWSDDQGNTWRAFNLGDLKRFKAEYVNGDATIEQRNRPQVATTMDGAIVFFSWLDTESPDIENNSQPDIYFREYLPTLDEHGAEPQNVTFLSAAMWTAYFGCMSHYVFAEVSESSYTCTIPFVYMQMTGIDPTLPVQYYYIPDFVRTYVITGETELPAGTGASVSQNYPNPFTGKSTFKLYLSKACPVSLEIFNITGKLVSSSFMGNFSKGFHQLEISAECLSKGIYFYSINYGEGKVTRKMIVN